MKKILVSLFLLFIGLAVQAEIQENDFIYSTKDFWARDGIFEEKVLDIGTKIINLNKLDKRVPIMVVRNSKIVNAYSERNNKTINIYTGILPYMDNDDELAYVIGHEMGHSIDSYDGVVKWIAMTFNSKSYEYKADLIGVDLMVKAGYNPVAAITEMNKWMPEATLDFGIFTSHPKTSKRMMAVYKYIYAKYPWALQTDMVKNVNYQNFLYSSKKEIEEFQQDEKLKEEARKSKYSL